ncbi:non-ribosomal peptide synthetase [Streptomyces collinus]|uniref:non-ribosomal peptide synthetase n=1 Tax=Streptomyces collinus TaxID=42684 RepID=UPI003420018D
MQKADTLLQQACEKFADATAIRCASESVRFSELSARAGALADDLRERDIGAGDVVAVLGRRSASVITAVFAVWKAGATVMLVDDALPEVRRETMLASGRARATVDCANGHRIESRPGSEPLPGGGPAGALHHHDDYAYIAFTSGSTGKPKAIVGSHEGLSRFLEWQSGEFGIGPQDRFAHFTNLSFDVWFRDALTPLISGATLCIPDGRHVDGTAVRDFLRAEEITAFHLVPSLGKVWLSGPEESEPIPGVRLSFFAGEPLDGALVNRWHDLFPHCQVVNLYGPTETTLAQHFHRVPRPPAPGIQPVGHNLPRSRSHVLDESGQPCADGVSGQIHIAADHPSYGYLVDGRIVSPFVELHLGGERVLAYPTGDLGRYGADGVLEILGRADDQVKIAGVRIELQEVRSAVQSHPSVRDAFVCAPEDRFTKTIVAIVEGDAAAERALRDHLSERLMSAMLPSAFLYLPELPKLPNGKTDRTALTEIARGHVQARRADSDRRAGAASGPAAARLERIWLSVAGGGTSSLADRESNFFDIGGTSLTIVALHSEIQSEFDVRFPLVRLFEYASFNAQCRFLDSLSEEPHGRVPGRTAATARAARSRVLSSRRTCRR